MIALDKDVAVHAPAAINNCRSAGKLPGVPVRAPAVAHVPHRQDAGRSLHGLESRELHAVVDLLRAGLQHAVAVELLRYQKAL